MKSVGVNSMSLEAFVAYLEKKTSKETLIATFKALSSCKRKKMVQDKCMELYGGRVCSCCYEIMPLHRYWSRKSGKYSPYCNDCIAMKARVNRRMTDLRKSYKDTPKGVFVPRKVGRPKEKTSLLKIMSPHYRILEKNGDVVRVYENREDLDVSIKNAVIEAKEKLRKLYVEEKFKATMKELKEKYKRYL